MRVFQAIAMATALTVVLSLMIAQQIDATYKLTHPETGVPKTFDFGAYVAKYKKYYSELETLNRAKLFYSRTLSIFKTNYLYATHKIDYYLRQNQFTDLSPEEMKTEFSYPGTDLKPVDEAKMSPDTPADKFVVDEHGTPSNRVFEPMTKSSLSEEIDPERESPMSFFSDPHENVNVRQLLAELHHDTKLAKDLSRVIEIENNKKVEAQKRVDLEKARQANNIVHRPYVESSNKNFDPSAIQTQGWVDNAELFGKNYAQFMMDDMMASLDPYPAPVAPRYKVIQKEATTTESSTMVGDTEGGILSSFMSSISELKEYLTWEFLDTDGFEREEEEGQGEEGEKIESPDDGSLKRGGKGEIRFDVDWRKSGCISAIKSQEHCNSCATFASLDLLEFLYCRQMKTSTEFSAQFLIDCGAKTGLRGCQGGKLSNVGMFIKKNGLQLNSVYPYHAREQECPFADEDREKSYMLKPDLIGWRVFPQISSWYKWIPKSPVVVGINMPADFLGYSGGIHDGNNCVPNMVHAMLLVGSGKEDGKPFWLLKNSFAETWGETGYFRLSKKAPIKCFNAALVAMANFKQT